MTDQKSETSFGDVSTLLVLGSPVLIWRGYVLTFLWGWFAVPLFGLPALRTIPAVGLCILVSFFHPPRDSGPEKPNIARMLVGGLLAPTIALAFGWLIHLLM